MSTKLIYTVIGIVIACLFVTGFSGQGYLHQGALVLGGLLIGIVFEKVVVDSVQQEG